MKYLLFALVLGMASCVGNSNTETTECDSVVTDSITTDSITADSLAVDSIM